MSPKAEWTEPVLFARLGLLDGEVEFTNHDTTVYDSGIEKEMRVA